MEEVSTPKASRRRSSYALPEFSPPARRTAQATQASVVNEVTSAGRLSVAKAKVPNVARLSQANTPKSSPALRKAAAKKMQSTPVAAHVHDERQQVLQTPDAQAEKKKTQISMPSSGTVPRASMASTPLKARPSRADNSTPTPQKQRSPISGTVTPHRLRPSISNASVPTRPEFAANEVIQGASKAKATSTQVRAKVLQSLPKNATGITMNESTPQRARPRPSATGASGTARDSKVIPPSPHQTPRSSLIAVSKAAGTSRTPTPLRPASAGESTSPKQLAKASTSTKQGVSKVVVSSEKSAQRSSLKPGAGVIESRPVAPKRASKVVQDPAVASVVVKASPKVQSALVKSQSVAAIQQVDRHGSLSEDPTHVSHSLSRNTSSPALSIMERLQKQDMRGQKMLEERRRAASAADADMDLIAAQVQTGESQEAPLTTIPVVEAGIGQWRMQGFFEHQVWAAGVRTLDQWCSEGIHELKRRADGSTPFFRQRLFQNLLSEEMQLKSIPSSDVSAAQGDLALLSLRQLVRLRRLHMHFTPGGGSVDSIHAIGDSHTAFIARLDGLLLEHLGRRGLQRVEDSLDYGGIGVSDLRRLGNSLLLISAVAPSLPSNARWICSFGGYRLYFNAEEFTCSREFPDVSSEETVGVFETIDSSKPHGRVLRLDWQINLLTREADIGRSTVQAASATRIEVTNEARCVSAPPRQPSLSASILQESLANLKKAHPHEAGV